MAEMTVKPTGHFSMNTIQINFNPYIYITFPFLSNYNNMETYIGGTHMLVKELAFMQLPSCSSRPAPSLFYSQAIWCHMSGVKPSLYGQFFAFSQNTEYDSKNIFLMDVWIICIFYFDILRLVSCLDAGMVGYIAFGRNRCDIESQLTL